MKFTHVIVIALLVIGGGRTVGLSGDDAGVQVATSAAAQAGVATVRAPAPSCHTGGCLTRSPGYPLPGFEVCPCGNRGCFHPARYYCGGKAYRKSWFRKWLRAHFGHGSMLEDVPCHCIHPVSVHTVPAVRPQQHSASPTEIAPAPAPPGITTPGITTPDGKSGM